VNELTREDYARGATAGIGSDMAQMQAAKAAPAVRRSTIHMSIGRAENGWVVSCGPSMWIAADATKLAALMEVLAEEFQERDVTL
jgi:hypothetical protein